MKIKQNFILQAIGNAHVLVSIGDDTEFHGVVHCNETATFLVSQLKDNISKEELCQLLVNNYSIDALLARKAVDYIINQLKSIDALEQ